MTRWARPGHEAAPSRNRKVCAASSWEDMRAGPPGESGQPPRKKKNGGDVNEDVNGFCAMLKEKRLESHNRKEGAASSWEDMRGSPPGESGQPPSQKKKNGGYVNEDVNGFYAMLKEKRLEGHNTEDAASSCEDMPGWKKKNGGYVNQDVNGFYDMQKDQRRESRRLKRQSDKRDKMVCFHCRKPGHGMADCSEALRYQEMGTGICFRCGSTEHELSKCKAKVDPALGEFPYAKCFICGEMGHLSRSCPDNPKGLYALGGSCRSCGSVEHFQRDCPENKTSGQVTVGRWTSGMSADHEDVPVVPKAKKVPTKTPKVVKF